MRAHLFVRQSRIIGDRTALSCTDTLQACGVREVSRLSTLSCNSIPIYSMDVCAVCLESCDGAHRFALS